MHHQFPAPGIQYSGVVRVCRHRNQTGATTRGSFSRQSWGARHAGTAANHQHMTEIALVTTVRTWRSKCAEHNPL